MKRVKEQGGVCIYCGVTLTFHYPNNQPCDTDATFEHLTPRSKGGNNTAANTAASCFRCNNDRGDQSHFRFLEKKKKRRQRNLLCG